MAPKKDKAKATVEEPKPEEEEKKEDDGPLPMAFFTPPPVVPDTKDKLLVPRFAEEFKGVFQFLDLQNNNAISKNEIKHVMEAMDVKVTDEECLDLLEDIGGSGATEIDLNLFLNFVAIQLKGSADEELKEVWKVMSGPKRLPDELQPDPDERKPVQFFKEPMIDYKDIEKRMKMLGEDLPAEEAEELLAQADANKDTYLGWEEFLSLLSIPHGD